MVYVIYRYSTVGRSVAKVNMPPRSDIEARDRLTVLYILYSTISVQQAKLLPENASQNDAIFQIKGQKSIWHISDYLAVLKFLWLCNHGTIWIIYNNNNIVVYGKKV